MSRSNGSWSSSQALQFRSYPFGGRQLKPSSFFSKVKDNPFLFISTLFFLFLVWWLFAALTMYTVNEDRDCWLFKRLSLSIHWNGSTKLGAHVVTSPLSICFERCDEILWNRQDNKLHLKILARFFYSSARPTHNKRNRRLHSRENQVDHFLSQSFTSIPYSLSCRR